jgi:hypothetical protein
MSILWSTKYESAYDVHAYSRGFITSWPGGDGVLQIHSASSSNRWKNFIDEAKFAIIVFHIYFKV